MSQKSFRERQALYVRQLESQLADRSSNNESTRIRAAQEESEKFRQALLAARKRILGLTTALSGVSENIGIALGLEADNLAGEHQPHIQEEPQGQSPKIPAGHAEDDALLPSMSAQVHQGGSHEQTTNPEGSQQPTLATSMPLLHGTNIHQRLLPSSYWSADAELPLDLDMSSPSLSLWQALEAGPRAGTEYNVSNTTFTNSELLRSLEKTGGNWVQKSLSDCNNLASGATRCEAHITANIHVSFPPGNAAFPSTFSAHLAACEFFIKQNRAYKQRTEPGGSEV